MDNLSPSLQEMRTTIWRTAGARFNAARRLKTRDRLSTFSIALFSAIGIFVSLFTTEPSAGGSRYLFLAVGISLFVLVISLLEGAGKYDIKAERLHRSAVALSALQRRLGLLLARSDIDSATLAKLGDEIRGEYENTVRECPENHDPIDDRRFKTEHRHSPEFKVGKNAWTGWFEARWVWLLYWASCIWLFFASWLVIGLLLVWMARRALFP